MKHPHIMGALATVLLAAALVACATTVAPQQKDAAKAEIGRLSSLAQDKNITEGDLATLDGMLAGDKVAQDELGELAIMVRYKEYEHAGHTLSFIADYLDTGEELVCPPHALAHYYVFARHGEEDAAADALAEAKEGLPGWIPKAKEYDKEYPTGQDIDAIAQEVRGRIDAIEAGNTTASDDDIARLATTESICVPE